MVVNLAEKFRNMPLFEIRLSRVILLLITLFLSFYYHTISHYIITISHCKTEGKNVSGMIKIVVLLYFIFPSSKTAMIWMTNTFSQPDS